jgi:hypothetical protein
VQLNKKKMFSISISFIFSRLLLVSLFTQSFCYGYNARDTLNLKKDTKNLIRIGDEFGFSAGGVMNITVEVRKK